MQPRGVVMKYAIVVVLLFVALSVWAHPPAPVIEYQLDPQYPAELLRAGLSGEVRVRFMVNAAGEVLSPHILYSTHPDFAGAVLKVIPLWRFVPRTLSQYPPVDTEVTTALVFNATSHVPGRGHAPPELSIAQCLHLNREIESYVRRNINMPLAELKLFRATRSRLIDGYVQGKYSSDQLSSGLYALSLVSKSVTKQCLGKASHSFVHMLPSNVQGLLKAGNVKVGVMEAKPDTGN